MAGNEINLKAAPRRAIVNIERSGSWGEVTYSHALECGHTENRKRPSTSTSIACAGCVRAEQYRQQAAKLPPPVDDDEILDDIGSRLAVAEKTAAQLKAEIVAHFNVPAEAVDIAMDDENGTLQPSYAVIILSADEMSALLSDQ